MKPNPTPEGETMEANNPAGRSDEQRVKEVYPDAHQDAYSPAIWASNSRQTLLVIGKNWHDAASRLPKEVPEDVARAAFNNRMKESRLPKANLAPAGATELVPERVAMALDRIGYLVDASENVEAMEFIRNELLDVWDHHSIKSQAEPAASPVEEGEVTAQTFEEWWKGYSPIRTMGEDNYLQCAWSAWNAAKASSPEPHDCMTVILAQYMKDPAWAAEFQKELSKSASPAVAGGESEEWKSAK